MPSIKRFPHITITKSILTSIIKDIYGTGNILTVQTNINIYIIKSIFNENPSIDDWLYFYEAGMSERDWFNNDYLPHFTNRLFNEGLQFISIN